MGIDNRGLGPIIDQLEPAVKAAAGSISRADVWVLAANMAIEFAGGPRLDFEIGRVDSSSCKDSGLPDAERGHNHIKEVFVQRLHFTERDTAALIGAHVLGRAEMGNSGYEGPWVPRNNQFSSLFFRDLLARPWHKREHVVEGTLRTQWNGPGPTMMLNTDIEIAFDTSSGCNHAGGRGRGFGGSCPRAAHGFSDAVTEFAAGPQGQVAFFEAFAGAFKKLTALGSQPLKCAFPDCRTPWP